MMNTANLNTNTVLDIQVTDIFHQEIDHLALLVSQWQKDGNFMRFLKEQPMSHKENLEILKKKIDSENGVLKTISETHIKDIIGFILFHNFDPEDKSLEVSFRINPEIQKKGACTFAVQNSLRDIFTNPLVEKIVGWHSVRNKGSFNVFKKSGFIMSDFIPQQTFLPNIQKQTDDFKREITKNLLGVHSLQENSLPPIKEDNQGNIMKGLKKHGFIGHI